MIYPSWCSKFQACIFVICSFVICAQSDVPRPRGVSLSKASLYTPTKDFTCFDGTITIPFSYVNDDYCDCFDGSDEPGTSACLNGVFHCANAGHRSQNIPSNRVNDGVCDCCDGTDEYATEGFCPNICESLGHEARAEAHRLAELHKAGSQVRLELIEKGNKHRSEMVEQVAQLERDRAEAEKIRAEKEALKESLEAKENEVLKVYRDAEEQERKKKAEEEEKAAIKEAMEHFVRFDANSDSILTREEMKVVNVFDKDKDGQVDEDEFKFFMNDEVDLNTATFLKHTWPVLKPLIMMEQGMFKPEEPTDDQDTEAEQIDDLDEARDDDTDLDAMDEHTDTDPQEEIDDHTTDTEQTRVYDDETQKIVDEATEARQELTEAERIVREIEAHLRDTKQNLEKDYGLQQEFATLDRQCFEYDDKEYTYRLCMFQKVTQKSKNGGSEIGLGSWGEWVGEGNNKYSVMKYINGVNCWNGPNRSTTVQVTCGLETKLLSVTEPYRCEYRIELSTPAACDDSQIHQHLSHDEL